MLEDCRHAIRAFAHRPGFTAAALLTLALGIAVNTAIFSVVNAVLVRPLPFADPDRIVEVTTSSPTTPIGTHNAGDFLDLAGANMSFEAVAGLRTDLMVVSDGAGPVAQVEGGHVTAAFFDVLRPVPLAGRVFTAADTGSDRLAVLSSEAATTVFGTPARAVGKVATINGVSCTVVGVLARGARWLDTTQVWLLSRRDVPPAPVDGAETGRDVEYFRAIARLKPGVSIEAAREDVKRVASQLPPNQTSRTEGSRGFGVFSAKERMVGNVRPIVLALQGAVAVVLLIACANVAGLLIARTTSRGRELAIRAAMGAGRGRLVRQLLTESLLLGLAGGALGLLGGAWLVSSLRAFVSGLPRGGSVGVDPVVATVTMLLAVAASAVAGAMPALHASRTRAAAALRAYGDRGGTGRLGGRRVLVVVEVALTVVLVVSAALLGRSLLQLERVDSGFRPDQVTTVSLMLPHVRYPTAAEQSQFYARLLALSASRAPVRQLSVAYPGPLHGADMAGSMTIEGRAEAGPADQARADLATVSGSYFQTMGLPVLSGRTFTEADGKTAPPVAIVNQAFVRRFLGTDKSPLGRRLRFDAGSPWTTVVGVAGDARQEGLALPAPPILYVPYQQFTLPYAALAIRSDAPDDVVAREVRAILADLDPDLTGVRIAPLANVLGRAREGHRFRAVLFGELAIVALVLASVGLYALLSFAVTQRTREMGIRMALGASPSDLLRQVVGSGVWLTAIGVVVGLAGAWAATRALGSFLFEVPAFDPVTFLVAAVSLIGVGAVASLVPAWRASAVDPLTALRAE